MSHTEAVALQVYFVFSHLVLEPLVGNLRSLGFYIHTPTPWVFTFMSFITPPPASEFKIKHLKFDQGCVLMSAWILCVPCFLKWFLPYQEKNKLTALYKLFSLHTPVFSPFPSVALHSWSSLQTPAFSSGSRINKTACGMKHIYIQVVWVHIWIFPLKLFTFGTNIS